MERPQLAQQGHPELALAQSIRDGPCGLGMVQGGLTGGQGWPRRQASKLPQGKACGCLWAIVNHRLQRWEDAHITTTTPPAHGCTPPPLGQGSRATRLPAGWPGEPLRKPGLLLPCLKTG